jgi:biotin carboxyl carrier protein
LAHAAQSIVIEGIRAEGIPAARRRMSTPNRVLFFLTAWLIVLMPFLFWWSTWFGRTLSDKKIGEYLVDEKHPRHIQHALVQIGERIGRHDAGAQRWYPELVRLSAYPVEEVRNTDAWVMGQDNSAPEFHRALLGMLRDDSPVVRGNAALSLVRFGDAAGRAEMMMLLEPARIVSPGAGRIVDIDRVGTSIHQSGLVAKLEEAGRVTEVRSPIAGRIRSVEIATGANVAAGSQIATVDPGSEQVWEALRGLYFVGRAEDLPVVRRFERELAEIPDRIRQQAALTDEAIQKRALGR